ncbi:hypothetical protein DFQ30_002551 [Apophysomyces sp. BC1015]|nr:hypothetical protein DFQ30_002551 [Apophysomyces sp. BC1015]
MLSLLNTTYNSKDELRDAVQRRAGAYGFAVETLNSNKYDIKLVCTHYGKYTRKASVGNSPEKQKPRARTSKKCSCNWFLRASMGKRTDGKWKVRRVYGIKATEVPDHNHAMAECPTEYHQHRRIDKNTFEQLGSMMAAGTTPSQMRVSVLTIRDIYNFRAQYARSDKNEHSASN